MTTKAQNELALVTEFLRAASIEGVAEPLPAGAGPDFRVSTAAHAFGIEVTEITRPSEGQQPTLRQREGVQDQILDGAATLWNDAGAPFVEVSVRFAAQHLAAKSDVPRIARRLVELVTANLPAVGQHQRVESDWQDPDQLPEVVDGLTILRLAGQDRSHWSRAGFTFLPSLSAQQVQERIVAKNAKLAQYTEANSEVWLLLVLDGFRLSGMFELPKAVLEHEYDCGFARAFLFQAFKNQVFELRRHGRSAPAA